MDGSAYETDEAGAVDACSATPEKTQDGDRAADKNEDCRQLLEERQKTGSGDRA